MIGAAPMGSAQASTPPSRSCGAFVFKDVQYRVKRNSTAVTCAKAKKVIRQLFGGQSTHHRIDNLPDAAHAYYTLPGQPGWRCTYGTGVGPAGSALCSKGALAVSGDGYYR